MQNEELSARVAINGSDEANGDCHALSSDQSCTWTMTSMESSQFSQVIFHDLYEFYPTDCELRCRYTLTENVKYAHGDRIGLYKVGWKFVTDFIAFKLAPIPLSEKEQSTLRVSFSANLLPKDEMELYQLCYITHDNKVIGASIPFGFRRPDQSDLVDIEDKNDPGLTVYKSRIAVLHDKIARLEEDKETAELKCHMFNERATVLEKELSSVTTSKGALNRSLDDATKELIVLKEKLATADNELQCVMSTCSNFESELNDCKLKYNKLISEMSLETVEKNRALTQLSTTGQGQIQAELMLKEMSDYNSKLKCEVDDLKQKHGVLLAEKESQMALITELKNECQGLKEENKRLTILQNRFNASASVGSHSVSDKFANTNSHDDKRGLDFQLNEALKLLDETFQNQPAACEQQTMYISQLEEDVRRYVEERQSYETQLSELRRLVKCKDEQLELQKSENHRLWEQYTNTLTMMTNIREVANNHETENITLKNQIHDLEKLNTASKTDGNIIELEQLVGCLKECLISEPSFENFYHILLESTRVNAMNMYKELFDSLQSFDFQQVEVGAKVRRVLDEFGILKQDLDRCRQELQDRHAEYELNKNQLHRITRENESYKEQIVEMKEAVNVLHNRLGVAKKDGDKAQEVEKLTSELHEMKMKNENLEQQLKEMKVANALTNIGQTRMSRSSSVAEINQLRSRLKELESRKLVTKECCGEMQERLKQSAKEYARLYNRLMSERAHYKAAVSALSSLKRSTEITPVSPEMLVEPVGNQGCNQVLDAPAVSS